MMNFSASLLFVAIGAFCLLLRHFFPSSGSPPDSRSIPTDRLHLERPSAPSELATFQEVSGDPREKRYMLEVMSGGVAIFDYDNDGKPDIYLVNGCTLDVLKGNSKPDAGMKSRLYHNLGGGKFEDVTDKAGVGNLGNWGMGACAADFDNDGFTDLFVTNAFGKNRLYKNNGNGTFTDVTDRAGVGGDPRHWNAGAAWADYDNDGYVDLFVSGYVDLDLNKLPDPGSNQYCRYRGLPVNCGPRGLKGAGDYLFHNNGDGTFTEVGAKAGVSDKEGYYGLGCVWSDFDGDGLIDLFVANDSTPNYLYHNMGNGTFKEIGYESGTAVNEDGREQACMGVDASDYDGDGLPDIFVTNFVDDSSTLYHNDGQMRFTDVTMQAALTEPVWNFMKWGTGFVDFDNDGILELFVANGHIYPEIEGKGFGQTYAERSQLFMQTGKGKFAEVREETLGKTPRVARGAAFADLDSDGRVDVVVNNLEGPPTVFLNKSESANWIEIKLVGKKSNRDAIGARVTITAGGKRQMAEVHAGSSYLSQNDMKLHFGVGAAKQVDSIEIRWPRGGVQKLDITQVNQVVRLEEVTK